MWRQSHCLYEPRKYVEGKALVSRLFVVNHFSFQLNTFSFICQNVYTKCTAAVLRAKESVMKTVTTVQENAGDIYAEAQQINEDRKAQETSYADESQTEE